MDQHRLTYAEQKLQQRLPYFGGKQEEVVKGLEGLQGCVKDWMTYLYATLPLTDVADYSFETWIPYVEHALKVRSQIAWCQALPEDIFADYVLYPRINTEDIEECRQLFYGMIYDRVKELDMEQAALEVNFWCQENATYQSADDRTSSAMTVYRSGSGRCGEESTFTVTALRSVGIPARQVYAPWWSHCDDNHAWVEVYIDGKWHFIGACEPEPIVDKGWFTNASSRAMLIHTRTFTGADNDADLLALYGAERAERCHVEEGVTYEHITENYALTKALRVKVVTADGQPAKGALVRFEILNMAEFSSVANMTANDEGIVDIRLGLGQIQVHAIQNGVMAEKMVQIQEDGEVTLTLGAAAGEAGEWQAFDFIAPLDYPMHPGTLTEEQRVNRDARMEKGTQMRNDRIEGFYKEEEASQYDESIQEILHLAKGNFDAIAAFLAEGTEADAKYRQAILKTLTKKDYRDVKKVVLEEHLQAALPYAAQYDEATFVEYVLCPRVFNETLTQYRGFISGFFSEADKAAFAADPAAVMAWIDENLEAQPQMDYHDLFYTPAEALVSGKTDPVSKKILFTAICRSLGIAARLNPVDGEAEYLDGDHYVKAKTVEKTVKATLELSCDKPEDWIYRQTFTVGRPGRWRWPRCRGCPW